MFRPQLLKTNLALYGSARLPAIPAQSVKLRFGTLLWMALLFLAVSSCALAQEFFNITNRTNFGTPNDIVFANVDISPSAGLITTTATSSRQIQFSLKLVF